MIDVARLVGEIAPEHPCGPNLEYDPEFADLERTAARTPERQIGDTVVPAKDPDWPDVAQRAQALLARSKDLRVAMHLTRALVHVEGLAGLAAGLRVVSELVTRYWDQAHPVIDREDHDPTARLNALMPLAVGDRGATPVLLRDAWDASVAGAGPARVTVRDVLLAQGTVPGGGPAKFDKAELGRTLRDFASKAPLPIDAAEEAVSSLDAVRSCIAGLDAASPPDLKMLTDALKTLIRVMRPASGVADSASGSNVPGQTLAGPEAILASAEIRGREDVVRQLDRICEFIQRTEPGHPAPLLIRRAQRLMSKDFLEIIKDLAPGSVGEVQKIAGIE